MKDGIKRRTADPSEIISVIRRVLSENGGTYLWHYAAATLCLLAIAGATAFGAWIMRDVVDQIFYRQRADLIALICVSILAAFTIRGLASYAQAIILAKVGNNLVARYQQRLFDHLMRLGMPFFNTTRSAQLAAQISQNVVGVRDLLGMTLTAMARDVVSLIALVVVMVMQNPVLSLIALTIGPPLVITVNHLMRRVRRISRDAVEVNSRLIGAMQEATQGIMVVKAFTMEKQLSSKMALVIADAETRSNKIARVSERLTPVSEMLAGFAVAGVIAYAGYSATYGSQSPGAVFSFITALLLAYDPARRLARVQVNLERSLVNVRMIYEILDLTPQQRDAPGARPLAVTKGEVRFADVKFGYSEEQEVLHGVSFLARAGKSTLTALLERFYDLDGGSIEIDGQDISTVTKQSLRQSIAYVSQQPYLFEGTIRDNIRYGRETASDADVERAGMLAAADEFIRQQPNGYETLVGENGVTLSGGQRQRLSIARAIVREAPILLLDEATSSLDTESEARVQEALDTIMQSRTVIVIAHRLSTVVNADHLVVLEDGRVVEERTHQSLLDDPHGLYARFHRAQSVKGLGLVDDTKSLRPAIKRPKRIVSSTGDAA